MINPAIFANQRTPLYYYDSKLLISTIHALKAAIPTGAPYHVHYAIKACANPQILRIIASEDLGADCVSLGEVEAALRAGFKPWSIVYAGVGKSEREIRQALSHGIGCFNVESIQELEIIQIIAAELGVTAPVALRVNPDIDAHTLPGITTGTAENKFGIPLPLLQQAVDAALNMPNIHLSGLHFHIGSQITDMQPYRELCITANRLIDSFKLQGIEFQTINVGGGLGIDYQHPDLHPIANFDEYFNIFASHLHTSPGQSVHFELGRSIVGQCGSLIAEALYVKQGVTKEFVILNAGFTDLLRPALYGARHYIENLSNPNGEKRLYDIVGPVCESTDTFAVNYQLPEVRRGDLIAIRSAGAYGESMASTYNCRSLPGSLID